MYERQIGAPRGLGSQRLDVRAGRRAQRFQVVPAFEDRYQAAIAKFIGCRAKVRGDPAKVAVLQLELPKGIPQMGVETRRHHDQVGPEPLHGRQSALAPGRAKFSAAVAGRQRQIEDVAAAGFLRIAGAGIQRDLMAQIGRASCRERV